MTAPVQQRTAEQILADVMDLLAVQERENPAHRYVSCRALRYLITYGRDES